jgi:hypothetical protein
MIAAAASAPTSQRAISLDITRTTLRDLPRPTGELYRVA